jgi:isopenicillin-N N-acyltransferase-like protein
MIQLIEAEGSNYEIGFIIGKKLKNRLKEIIRIEERDYKKESGKSLSEHMKRLKQIIIISKKYFPQYVGEIEGMAEGSGIDFNYILALGCETDLAYNCTSIAEISKNGMLLGHNEDWLLDHLNYLYICKISQRNKPDSISLSYVGHLPGFSIGLNSGRFAYTGNSLYCKNINRNGIPLQFFSRAFLDIEKYDDVIKLASMKNRAVGGNSLMIFKSRIFDLEMTPNGYAIIDGRKYLAHTNHVLSKRILSNEKRHDRDSVWRLDQANKMLANNEVSFNLFKEILSDHKHRPNSICCHEYEKGRYPYATLASVIINVSKGKFFVAPGNPCKSKYKEFDYEK